MLKINSKVIEKITEFLWQVDIEIGSILQSPAVAAPVAIVVTQEEPSEPPANEAVPTETHKVRRKGNLRKWLRTLLTAMRRILISPNYHKYWKEIWTG